MNNIILCGFMGCGKTTVGTLLARRLGMEYADLDAEIEAEAGMAIPAIFAEYGEARFRDLEHEAVRALAGRADCVVSTGGGALTYPRNREVLSPRDLVVFLDAPFDACLERIRGSDRPIVRRSSPEELRALFDARRPAYLAAANAVADASAGPEAVAEAVARLRAERGPALWVDKKEARRADTPGAAGGVGEGAGGACRGGGGGPPPPRAGGARLFIQKKTRARRIRAGRFFR